MLSAITKSRLITVLVTVTGAFVFLFLRWPLPFLLGPLLFGLFAAIGGQTLNDLGTLNTYMRTFLGVAAGASIKTETVAQLPAMAGTLAVIPIFVLVIGLVGYPLFRYGFRMNPATSWYAAMPGGLQDMLVFGEEAGGDSRALSLIHATRVLVIVTVTPWLLSMLWDVDLNQLPGEPAIATPPSQILVAMFAGLVGWKVAARLKMFGASILGPMILATLLSLTGVLTTRPPTEIILLAQLFIAITIASRYSGINLGEVRTAVLAGLVFCVALAILSALVILTLSQLRLAPPLEISLAFLPGGQAEMVLLAMVAQADMSFVVSHHLLRLITVITCAPVASRFLP